ncbi:putative DNA topoisomerase [Medicago truncatula]|uniref:DNA topoisomerase n=1 Tax=Medicago truncatula TaxID=3880 RepID=A0A396J7A2_MEDTR|nr:putative DNA topoisomerase [Medicago truncatula]
MAVEASGKLNTSHKFIRSSESNQLHSNTRKSTSHSHDGRSYKNTSNVLSSNDQSSSSQNGKVIRSAMASAVESSVGISNASTSNLKTYTRSPSTKHLKEDRREDSADEEDSMPLSVIRMKMNNANVKKATPNVLKKSYEDFDDDIPLSARLSQITNYDDSDKQEKASTLSVKRPLDEFESLHSSGKKSKLSHPASSINAKQTTMKCDVKAEEEEEDDDIPISRRMNKLANKSSYSKKLTNDTKVNKVDAPSFKKKARLKKSGNKSKHVKSTKHQLSSGDGQKKWTTLVHNGVIFPPPYKPHGVKILYKGKPVTLTPEQEEVATMFAVTDTKYSQNEIFKVNFWNDWRKLLGENHMIQNLKDCDITPIYDWCQIEKDKKKQMSSAEKKALKEEKMKQEEKYMWAIVDGVKEKVGSFRVEPPGLFIGRGEHPKIGKVKRRILPHDVTINIGKYAPIPECPIPGESWKITHEDTVTWLAKWCDPIDPKLIKYVWLGASSSLKGKSDKEKYEKARMLKSYIGNIRAAAYTKGFKSKYITKQQIAVATYFIDKLALRAGNEKVQI